MKNFKTYKLILNSSRHQENGSVLVITIVVSAIMFAVLTAYIMFAENIEKFSKADRQQFNTFYTASSALSDRSNSIIAALKSNPDALKNVVLQSSTPFDCLRGTSINSGATACNNFRINVNQINPKYDLSSIEQSSSTENYNGYTAVTDKTAYLDYTANKIEWNRLSPDDTFASAIAKSYFYTIGSLGVKQDSNKNVRAQLILQANLGIRNLPIFQFYRFSFGTDTIVIRDTGESQAINGRYHANGDLTLINNNSANGVLSGQWTVSGQLRLTTGNNYIKLSSGDTLIPVNSPVPFANIKDYTPVMKTSDVGMRRLVVPNSELLKPKSSAGALQPLYGNANIRIIRRNPKNGSNQHKHSFVPFQLTAIQNGGSAKGTAAACTDLSPDRENLSSTKCQVFTKGMLVSLTQPVLFNSQGSLTEEAKYCKDQPAPAAVMGNYPDRNLRVKILRAVQIILSTNKSYRYNLSVLNDLPLSDALYQDKNESHADISELLGNIPGIAAADIPIIGNAKIQSLAASINSCFLAPPVQVVSSAVDIRTTAKLEKANELSSNNTFKDRRENKLFAPLQVNLESLSVWNRDGIYGEFPSDNNNNSNLDNSSDKITPPKLRDLLNSNTANAAGNLWVPMAADASKIGTLAESGLAAKSLIIHNTEEVATSSDPAPNSAFIYNGAEKLPSPTSIVSDRPVYIQGNWNSVSKQPSAIMADVVTILSTNCLSRTDNKPASIDANGKIIPIGQVNCGVHSKMNIAGDTVINTAILSGVNTISGTNIDSTPIRYLEDWTNKALTLKTSFAINGSPTTTTANFVNPSTGNYSSAEYFRYPTTINMSFDSNFAESNGLPPGTPMAVDITINGIERKYREGEKENIQKNYY
jgi:hypothetical protein